MLIGGSSPVTAATGFKRLGIAIVAAVVAGAGALGIASFLISADSARDAVAAEIRAVTGLEPTLRGPAAVSLFPSGTVEFAGVRLGDSRGGPALAAERLVARLRTLPLLAGRIEISDVTLESPSIRVDIDGNGDSNWTPLLGALSRALAPGGNRVNRSTAFSQLNISNGTMVVHDTLHEVTETLTSLDLALALPSSAKSFGATGRFVWRGEAVDATLSFGDFLAALTGDLSAPQGQASPVRR